MLQKKYKVLLALLLACVVSAIAWLSLSHLLQPIYDGKRIGEWFDDLSIATPAAFEKPERRNRYRDARFAFRRFDSNAVPFLAKQLRAPNAPLQEALIVRGRQLPVVGQIFDDLLVPRQKRAYALEAIKIMGTNAGSAVPALVASLQREPNTNLTQSIVVALGRASGYDPFAAVSEARMLQRIDEAFGTRGPVGGGGIGREEYDPRDYDREQVLRYVRLRYPHCFPNSER
jgi:hypothetical protein